MHVLTSSPSHRSSPSQSKPSPSKPSQLTTALALSALCIVGSGCFYELDRAANLAVGEVRGTLTLQDGSQAAYAEITISGRPTSTLAGSQGAFSVTDLPSGKWLVRFAYDADGDGWPEQSGGRSFIMLPGQGVDLGEVRLFGVGALSGVVHDAAGQPVGGAKVVATVTHESDDDALGFTYEETTVTSATDGRYFFAALPGARAQVLAFEPARPEAVSPSREVTLSPNETVPTGEPLVLPAMPSDRRPVTLDLVPPPAAGEDVFVEIVPPGTPATDYDFSTAPPGDPRVLPFTLPFVLDLPGGLWDIRLKTSSNKKGAALRRVIKPGRGVLDLGNLNLVDQFCPDGDCDGDGIVGLPPYAEAPDVWAACHAANAECALASGIRTEDKSCTVDGTQYDCEDDGDGQADLTEPTCYGVGLGTDRDGDLLCDGEDPYPYCRANDETCVPEDVENLDPQPQLPDLPTDAGIVDAGPEDAGVVDAGPEDAGVELDAGIEDAGVDAGIGVPDAGPTDAGPTDAGVDAGIVVPPFDGEWMWTPAPTLDFSNPIGLAALGDGRTAYMTSGPEVHGCPAPLNGVGFATIAIVNTQGACEASWAWSSTVTQAGEGEYDVAVVGADGNEVVVTVFNHSTSAFEVSKFNVDDGGMTDRTLDFSGGYGEAEGVLLRDGRVVVVAGMQGTFDFGGGHAFTTPQDASWLVRMELDADTLALTNLFTNAATGVQGAHPGGALQLTGLDDGRYVVSFEGLQGDLSFELDGGGTHDLFTSGGHSYLVEFIAGQAEIAWAVQFFEVGDLTFAPDDVDGSLLVGYGRSRSATGVLFPDSSGYVTFDDGQWPSTVDSTYSVEEVVLEPFSKKVWSFERLDATSFAVYEMDLYYTGDFPTQHTDITGWEALDEPFIDGFGQMYVYARDSDFGHLAQLDRTNGLVTPLLDIGRYGDLAYSPQERRVYQTNGGLGVNYIDLDNIQGGVQPATSFPQCGMSATQVTVSHDSSTLAMYCDFISEVLVVDLNTPTNFHTLNLGPIGLQVPPADMLLNADGSVLYVSANNQLWEMPTTAGATPIQNTNTSTVGALSLVTVPASMVHHSGGISSELPEADIGLLRVVDGTVATDMDGTPSDVRTLLHEGASNIDFGIVQPLPTGEVLFGAKCVGDSVFIDQQAQSHQVTFEPNVLADRGEICVLRIDDQGALVGWETSQGHEEQFLFPWLKFDDGSLLLAFGLNPEVRFAGIDHGRFSNRTLPLFWRTGVHGPTLQRPAPPRQHVAVELPQSPGTILPTSIDYKFVKTLPDGSFVVAGKVNTGAAFPADTDCTIDGTNGTLFAAHVSLAGPQPDCLWSVSMGGNAQATEVIDDVVVADDGDVYVLLSNNDDIAYFDGSNAVTLGNGSSELVHAVLHLDNAGVVQHTATIVGAFEPTNVKGFMRFTPERELVVVAQVDDTVGVLEDATVLHTSVANDSVFAMRLDENLGVLSHGIFDPVGSITDIAVLDGHGLVLSATFGSTPFHMLTPTSPNTGGFVAWMSTLALDMPSVQWSAFLDAATSLPITVRTTPGGGGMVLAWDDILTVDDVVLSANGQTIDFFTPGINASAVQLAWFERTVDGFAYTTRNRLDTRQGGEVETDLVPADFVFGPSGQLFMAARIAGEMNSDFFNASSVGESFDESVAAMTMVFDGYSAGQGWSTWGIGSAPTSVTAMDATHDNGMVLVGPVSSLDVVGQSVSPQGESNYIWVLPGDGSISGSPYVE